MLTLSLLLTVCCCTLATVAQSVTEECSDAAPFAELFKQIQSDLRHWDKVWCEDQDCIHDDCWMAMMLQPAQTSCACLQAPITAKMMDDVLLEKDTYVRAR